MGHRRETPPAKRQTCKRSLLAFRRYFFFACFVPAFLCCIFFRRWENLVAGFLAVFLSCLDITTRPFRKVLQTPVTRPGRLTVF